MNGSNPLKMPYMNQREAL